ncbi:recombinase family protein [Escherichia coli]|nr:recombinase family protein [Escherichia coli]
MDWVMSPSSGDALLCFVKRTVPAGSKGTSWYRQDYTQHKVVVGHSMRHLVVLVEELRERGVNFRSLTDAIDTSTPMGRFFFHVMGALAEMERELIVERTRAGFAAARQEGRNGGRKPKLTVEQWEQAGRLIES